MSEPYRVPVMETDRSKAGLAIHLVATATGLSARRIASRDRLRDGHCRARWLAMYLSHIAFGWPLERVGHAFGLNRATASTACRWAEDARDDDAYDTVMDGLETCLRAVSELPAVDLALALGAGR